eukprot:6733231-Pyramimonas_sp.AAC.1
MEWTMFRPMRRIFSQPFAQEVRVHTPGREYVAPVCAKRLRHEGGVCQVFSRSRSDSTYTP